MVKQSAGTVAIENFRGRVRLRWNCEGKRYTLSLGLPFSGLGERIAKSKASEIELDIITGNFDPSLARYYIIQKQKPVQKSEQPDTLLELWDNWVKTLDLSDRTYHADYKPYRAMIAKVNPSIIDCGDWYRTLQGLSPRVYNKRLGYLRRCCKWGIEQKLIQNNPFESIKPRKAAKQVIRPFTPMEIKAILEAMRGDRFMDKYSAFTHSHYADWVEFQFLCGTRPAESIGLQRRHIDFEKGLIEISEALARGDRGQPNGAGRVRKGTKSGSVRYLPMTPRLKEILTEQCGGLCSNDLVFTSPKKNAIDDVTFGRKVWKHLVKGLGLEYRRFYVTRHTFASIALEQGTPIATVAYLLGHSDLSMITRTYGHIVSKPVMPDILA
jgi:integrase